MKHSVRIKLTIVMALQDKTDSHSKNHFLAFTELSLYKILSILKEKPEELAIVQISQRILTIPFLKIQNKIMKQATVISKYENHLTLVLKAFGAFGNSSVMPFGTVE